MPNLKTGGSRRSAKASSASLRRKRKTSSDPGRLLTPSEIDALKSAIIKVNDELDRIIANDPARRSPTTGRTDAMPTLNPGGSRLPVTALATAPSRKRATPSGLGRRLTLSEIESLKSDFKRIHEEARQLIANDPTRRQPQAACEDTMPKLVSLEHAGAYAIRVRFADGVEGEIDLAQELNGEMFEPLRDPQLFAQFRLDPDTRTIVWPNGADLAAAFVRQMLRAVA